MHYRTRLAGQSARGNGGFAGVLTAPPGWKARRRRPDRQTTEQDFQENLVIDTELPSAPPASALTRGFAACLASVTEVPVTELPLPDTELKQALGAWRTWLAEHGSGLVPIADPTRFQWAGWWIAVVEHQGVAETAASQDEAEVAALAFGTPSGIVLSPQTPTLLGCATADLPIIAAYAVASLDPVLRPVPAPASSEMRVPSKGWPSRPRPKYRCSCWTPHRPTLGADSTVTATPPAPAPSAPEPTGAPGTT
jgi:hypothetical protein